MSTIEQTGYDELYKQIASLESLERKLREALVRISRGCELHCGCKPCTGDCLSDRSLRIVIDEVKDLADAALADRQGEGDIE